MFSLEDNMVVCMSYFVDTLMSKLLITSSLLFSLFPAECEQPKGNLMIIIVHLEDLGLSWVG